MSLRLRVASIWMPWWMLLRELERIDDLTTSALESLLAEHAPGFALKAEKELPRGSVSLKVRRAAMARAHNSRVGALASALGRDKATTLGREAMFTVGVALGQEAHSRLQVTDSVEDLLRAARVLYRVLGISFRASWEGEGKVLLTVDRCALADHYSEMTCSVLSAADEGVVQGLNPRLEMSFGRRITAGNHQCIAHIRTRQVCGGS